MSPFSFFVSVHDAVIVDHFPGYLLHGDYPALMLVDDIQHLRNHARAVVNDIVRENHHEWLIAHRVPGSQDRVAQPKRFLLDHEGNVSQAGNIPYGFEKIGGPGFFQTLFQFRTGLEVCGYGFLPPGGDHDHFFNARLGSLFHHVLQHGPVQDRQQFFGHRFGDGQEAGAQPGGRYNGFLDLHGNHLLMQF